MSEKNQFVPSVDALRKEKRGVSLTDQFADRVNVVGGLLDGSVQIKDLNVKSPGSYSTLTKTQREEALSRAQPPEEWKAFLDTLTPHEKGPLISALTRISNYQNLGIFREAPIARTNLSSMTITFLRRAFRSRLLESGTK